MIPTYLFMLGAVAGSFLSVCVHRLPRMSADASTLRTLSSPPSACPKCGRRIPLRDNIPILGWLLLRGRCRACGLKIPIRYPLLEIANGCLWVLLYMLEVPADRFGNINEAPLISQFGPVFGEHPFLAPIWLVHARYAFHLLLLQLLVVAALIDAATKTIPKVVTDPFIFVGILGGFVGGLYLLPITVRPDGIGNEVALIWRGFLDTEVPELVRSWFDGPASPAWRIGFPGACLHGGLVAVVGAIAGAVPILFMRVVGRFIYGREAMGAGDVYLMMLIGAFLGWQAAFASLVLASFIAAGSFVVLFLFGARAEIPFGPYLAAGAMAILFGWPLLQDRVVAISSLGPLLVPLLAVLAVAFVVVAYLMRLVLHPLLCRLPGYREDWYAGDGEIGEWTAADQNQFFAGSRLPEDRSLAGGSDWQGESVASGFSGENAWRDG